LLLHWPLAGILALPRVAALTLELTACLTLASEGAMRLLRARTRRHAGGSAVRRVDQATWRVDGRRGDNPVAVLIDDGGTACRARRVNRTWHCLPLSAEPALPRGLRSRELSSRRVLASRGELPAERAWRHEQPGHRLAGHELPGNGLAWHRLARHRLARRRELPGHRLSLHVLAGGRCPRDETWRCGSWRHHAWLHLSLVERPRHDVPRHVVSGSAVAGDELASRVRPRSELAAVRNGTAGHLGWAAEELT
jgi:hypothetical protein